jgi:DNA-binding NarL/FixJ family response regulator
MVIEIEALIRIPVTVVQESVEDNMRRMRLTQREAQIFQEVVKRKANKEIAADLNISGSTVKHYVSRLFSKLQVRNRWELAALATCGTD